MNSPLLIRFFASMLLIAPVTVLAAEPIFSLKDPRGDDRGDGTLVYPLRDDLRPGDLDIISFSAKPDSGGTLFEAVFARPIAQPGRRTIDSVGASLSEVARFGFYTFNIDIYIDTDRRPGSGRTQSLPGRRVEIDPSSAWEKAVCLTPRPFESRDALRRLWMNAAKRTVRERTGREDPDEVAKLQAELLRDVESHILFPTQVNVVGPYVRFVVPSPFLGGVARADLSYVIAVSAADLEQKFDLPATLGLTEGAAPSLMILPVAPGTWRDRFGGGRDDDWLQPPLVDIIVPEGADQKKILRDYDLRANRPVRLPGVVPAAPTPVPQTAPSGR